VLLEELILTTGAVPPPAAAPTLASKRRRIALTEVRILHEISVAMPKRNLLNACVATSDFGSAATC
jgi:hypothetical protein